MNARKIEEKKTHTLIRIKTNIYRFNAEIKDGKCS